MEKSNLLWKGRPKQGYILDSQFYRSIFLLFFLLGFTFLINFLFPKAGIVFYGAPMIGAVMTSINLFSYQKDKVKREKTGYAIYENRIERNIDGKTDSISRMDINNTVKSKRKGVYSFQFKKTGETKFDNVSILDVDLNSLPGEYAKITCVDKS